MALFFRLNLINFKEQSPCLEANSSSASQKNSPHFMELEGSLPYSQKPAISSYDNPG